MSLYLNEALSILNNIKSNEPKIKEAQDLFNNLSKTASESFIHDPKFQNVINLLTPFVVNYKVNQVLKLLKEMAKEKDAPKGKYKI